MISTFYHPINYQQEVWSLINKYDSFDIKSIPHIESSDTSMLMDEDSNFNLDDGSIDMKCDVETCRSLIPSTSWGNLNDDRHTSKVSRINEEQHESLLHAPVSDQNLELQDLLENNFSLHDTYKVLSGIFPS